MANIALFSQGITSYLHSSLELAKRLQRRGHTVVFYSRRTQIAEVCARHGFDSVLYVDSEDEKWESSPTRRQIFCRWREDQNKHPASRRTVQESGKDTNGPIDREKRPDFALIESELYAEMVHAMSAKIPFAVIEYMCSIDRVWGIPPLSSTHMPNDGLSWHLRSIYGWGRLIGGRVFRRRELKRRQRIRGLSRDLGVIPPPAIAYTHWQQIRFAQVVYLHFAAWEMDFPRPEQDLRRYLGPLVFRGNGQFRGDSSFEAALGSIVDEKARAQSRRPLVYCSLGSVRGNETFNERVLELCERRPDADFILANAGQRHAFVPSNPPANAHFFHSVPQYRVLEHADAAIVGAGIGTINECIFAGVPMVVYSDGVLDQNGNAARVAHHGLGVRGSLAADTVDDMDARLTGVLGNLTYQRNLRRMQEVYRRYDTEDRATSVIEGLISD